MRRYPIDLSSRPGVTPPVGTRGSPSSVDEDQDGREGGRFDTGRSPGPVPREAPGLGPSDRPTDSDRRERVGFALYMVGMLGCQFSRLRGDSAPWSEVLGLGIIVAAQYSLLLRPFSERTLRLLAAGTIALLFARARATGAESVIAYCARLTIFAASAQAILLGYRRARRQIRPPSCSPTCPVHPASGTPSRAT